MASSWEELKKRKQGEKKAADVQGRSLPEKTHFTWEELKAKKNGNVSAAEADAEDASSSGNGSVRYTWEQLKAKKAGLPLVPTEAQKSVKRGTYTSEVTTPYSEAAAAAFRLFKGEDAPASSLNVGAGTPAAKKVAGGFVGPLQQKYIREETQEKQRTPLKPLEEYAAQKSKRIGAGEAARTDYTTVVDDPEYSKYRWIGEGMVDNPVAKANADADYTRLNAMTSNNPAVQETAGYTYMTKEQQDIYNYLFGNTEQYGKEAAQDYYDRFVRDSVNAQQGEGLAQGIKELPTWFKPVGYGMASVATGADGAMEGYKGLSDFVAGNEDARAKSATQYAGERLAQDMNLPGRIAWDVGSAVGQQLPQMTVGFLTGGLGTALRAGATSLTQAASILGSRYNEELRSGASVEEARKAAIASAAIETATEMVGGVEMLSGFTLSGKKIDKLVDGISSAVGKIAVRTGFDMLGEGFEEGVSGVLEPLVRQYILGQGEAEINVEEVAYQALIGALSGGVLGAPVNTANAIAENREKAARAAAQSVKSEEATPEQKHNAAKKALEIADVEKADELADAVVKMANGEELTQEEMQAVATTEGALEVAKEIASAEVVTKQDDAATETSDTVTEEYDEDWEEAPEELEGAELDAWYNRQRAVSAAAKLGGERRIHEEIYDMGGGQQDAEAYADEFERAYNRGANNLKLTDEIAASYTTLNPDQAQAAWNEGRKAYETTIAKAPARSKVSMNGNVGSVDATALKGLKLNTNQRAAIRASHTIAEALGIKVVWEASEANEQGKRESMNGWYLPKDQSIHLDIYAGSVDATQSAAFQYATMRTFSHELTHYIQDQSPAQYAQLRDMVFGYLQEQGMDVEALIEEKAKNYSKVNGYTRFDVTQEVIADACEMMLRDSTAVETAMKKDPSLWERIKEKFAEFVEDLRAAFGRVDKLHPEARALMREAEGVLQYAEDLQRKWDEALLSTMEEQKNPAEEQRNTEQYAPRNYDVEISRSEIDSNIELVKKMEPVVMLKGDEAILHDGNLKENVLDFYQKNGNVATNRVLGDVQLTKSSYKSDMGHGMTPLKALTFWAVPGTIEKGEIISYSENWKDRGYRTYVIAAPITIEQGERRGDYWSGVVVKADANMQNVYAHDALMIKKEGPAALQNGAAANAGDTVGYRSSIHKILQQLNEVKREEQKEATETKREGVDLMEERSWESIKDRSMRPFEEEVPEVRERKTLRVTSAYMSKSGKVMELSRPHHADRNKGADPQLTSETKIMHGSDSSIAEAPEHVNENIRYSVREPVTNSAAFRKWFGESKVVNADGTPMVVYHGTDAYDQINVFKRGKKGWLGPGIYLAQDKNDAQHYADKSGYGGRVYELYARVENPLVVTQSNPVPEILQAAYNRSSIYEKRSAKQANDVSILTPADIKKLQEKGYDGIIWKFGKRPWEINVFSPEQLKSATDNTGAYSRESKDIRYQAREYDQISDRELLATATNSMARNAKERAMLDKYRHSVNEYLRKQTVAENMFHAMSKANISREAMIARQEQYQQILEEIDQIDRQLLEIEYDEDIQALISRERSYIRERTDEARRKAVAEYRDRRNAAEARAVVRRIITGTVKRLHNRLERPTPEHFVNDDMRRSIETLVKAFSPEGTFSKENLADVQSAYKNMFGNPDEIDATGFDDRTYENLGDLRNQLDGKKLTELTMNQLRMLRESIENIFHVIQHEETTFVQGRRENVAALASAVEAEAKDQGEYIERQGLEGARDFLNNGNATPIYFFKRIGGTLQRLFNEFLDGEGVYARDMQEAGDKIRELKKKYHYDEWADKDDDRLTFVTTFGQEITLDREIALGLWATRQREMRDPENEVQHLRNGGFQYEEREWEKRKNKVLDKIPLGKKRTGEKTAYRLADEDNNRIAAWLTPEQRGYATEMVQYLSTNMAEKGNEVSRKLKGYSIFGEGFYYPYKSSSVYMSESLDKIESAMLKNSGFTKKITKNASNPIVAGRFTDVWADHVNRMSMYHAMAIPQDSFWRVYNNRTPSSKEDGYASVKAAIIGAYGSGANKYIKQLMTDIYGGVASAYGDSIAGQMMSKFKRNAVAMSMSVVVQQPSSIARAFAVINPKYFVNTKGVSRKRAKADMMKYSATAFVKGMGRFDMNAGRSATEWLLKRDLSEKERAEKVKAFFKDPSVRDDVFGFLPQIMDEMTWAQIWNAAKAETSEKTKLTGEELLKATAKRFDEVIRETQVYDSVLVRSQFMRSKSAYAKMATAFMAEPTLSYNMMMEAARVAKTDKKTASAIVGSVTAAAVLNAVLKSFVSAYRDKDEDKTYVEKYIASLVSDLTGDVLNTKQGPASVIVGLLNSSLLPFNNIPLVQDAISIFQGYDVTRSDMNILVDAYTAYTTAFNDNKTLYEKLYAAAKPASALTGWPISNVWRDAEGIVNLIVNDKRELQDTSARGIKYAVLAELGRKNTQSAETERMLDAAISGDKEAYERLRVHVNEDLGLSDGEIASAMKSRIRERYLDGGIGTEEAAKLLEEYGDLADEKDDKYAAERLVREWDTRTESGNDSAYGNVWNYISDWDGKALKAEIKELKALGVKESSIRTSVTNHFKEDYLQATGREKTDLKAHLITAFTMLGMTSAEAKKKIESWKEE